MKKLKKLLVLGFLLVGTVALPQTAKADIAVNDGVYDTNPYNGDSFAHGHVGEGLVSNYGINYRIGVTYIKDTSGSTMEISKNANEADINNWMKYRYVPVNDNYFHIYILPRYADTGLFSSAFYTNAQNSGEENPNHEIFGGYEKLNEPGAQWYFVQNHQGAGEYMFLQTHSTNKDNTCYFVGNHPISAQSIDVYITNWYNYAGNDYTDFLYTAMVANSNKPLSSVGQSVYDWMSNNGIITVDNARNTLYYLLCPQTESDIGTWSGANGLNNVQKFENADIHWRGNDRNFSKVMNTIWYNACVAKLGQAYGKDVTPYIDNITQAILPTATGYRYINTVESVQCVGRSKAIADSTGDWGGVETYLQCKFPNMYQADNRYAAAYGAAYASLNDVQFNDTDITIGYSDYSYNAAINQAISDQVALARLQYCNAHPGLTVEELIAAVPDPVFPIQDVTKSFTGVSFASTTWGKQYLWDPWYGDSSHSVAYFITIPQFFGMCINCDITDAVYVPKFWRQIDAPEYTNTLKLMQDTATSAGSQKANNLGVTYVDYLFSNSPLAQLFFFNSTNAFHDIRQWTSNADTATVSVRDDWVRAAAEAGWHDTSGIIDQTQSVARYWGKHLLTEFVPGARIAFDSNGAIYYVTNKYVYPGPHAVNTFLPWSVCTNNSCSLSVEDAISVGSKSGYSGRKPQFGFCCFSPNTPIPGIRNLTGGASSFKLKSLTQGSSAISGDTWDNLNKSYGYIPDDNINIYNNLTDITARMDDNSWKIVQIRKYFNLYEGYVDMQLRFNKFTMDDYSEYNTGWRDINSGDKYRGNTIFQYRTTTASPSGVTYTISNGSSLRIPYQDVYWVFFQAQWELVSYDTITGKISPLEKITEGYDIVAAISDRPYTWIGLPSNTGAQGMNATRTVQYFHASTRNQAINAYAEVKDGELPGQETYEAMAGVPSTEKVHFTFGGTSYIVEIKYTSQYNKTIGDKAHCNYLDVISYDVWSLDKADVTGLGTFSPSDSATATIDNGKLNIRFTEQRVVAQGSGYRVYGDTLEYIDETGNWKPLVMTYYDVSGNYFSGNHYDDIRGTATERLLCVVNNGIFGEHSEPSMNQKTTTNSPFERKIPDDYFAVVGYNGKAAELNSPSDWKNKFTYVKPSTKIEVIETTVNGLKDNIKAKTTYKKLHGTDNTVYTKDTKYIPGSQYSVNPIIIHDPVAVNTVNITPQDFTVSYNHNFNASSPEATEPADQRVTASATGPVAYTTNNKLFIEYDFALGVNYIGDFSNNIADNYGLANPIRERGLGLNSSTINTTRWIKKVEVRFPVAVTYNGTLHAKNTWIELPLTDNAKSTGKETYIGFHIPLTETEMDDGQIQLRVTAINAGDNPNSLAVTNKERNTSYVANHQALKKDKIDVVGHIGGLEMLDTGDYRFSNLFKGTTSGWLVDNVIKNVDYSRQEALLVDPLDTLRKHETLNMFGTQDYRSSATLVSLPLTPIKNNIASLRKQPLRLGYNQYLSLETVGNYYGDFFKYNFSGALNPNTTSNKEVEIRPHYYYVDITNGTTTPVDVYAPVKGAYKMINDYDESYISNSDEELYEWMYKLDWANENVRRMYVSEEQSATNDAVRISETNKEVSAVQENTINIGNADKLFLRASSRTYIGYDGAERQSQRWHFTLGLPSGSVFVPSGEHEVSDDTILSGGCVLTTLEIVSKGEVWNLQYKNTLTENTIKIAPGLPDVPWTNPNEIPVSITSIDKSASNDLDIKGTH